MPEYMETIIVGGGQAGLAASHYLAQQGWSHVVFEKSMHPAHSWRDRRWDSFTVTPNWMTRMPGAEYRGADPDGFLPRDQVVEYLAGYAARFRLPVRYGIEVTSVDRRQDGVYSVATSSGVFESDNVVVATGLYQAPKIPAFSRNLPESILQMHSSEYRNPDALPAGSVLVVGAGQSGAQIAEELYQSGRRVFLSAGRTLRVPRRYRGRDIHHWSQLLGLWDRRVGQLKSPREKFEVHPTISGRSGGRTLNLHQFAHDGVALLGRLRGIEGGTLVLASDLQAHLAEADQFEVQVTTAVDRYIEQNGISAPPADLVSIRDGYDVPSILRLDLNTPGVATVIWATGYTFDFSVIHLPVRDTDGYPIQKRGITEYPGLYFLGMPWLHSRKSGLLYGIAEDAAHVVSNIVNSRRRNVAEAVS